MMSSDHDGTTRPGTDYVHNDAQFQAEVAKVLSQNQDLNDVIRTLFRRGYGKLLIWRGLQPYSKEESAQLKRRVIRVVNELIER